MCELTLWMMELCVGGRLVDSSWSRRMFSWTRQCEAVHWSDEDDGKLNGRRWSAYVRCAESAVLLWPSYHLLTSQSINQDDVVSHPRDRVWTSSDAQPRFFLMLVAQR